MTKNSDETSPVIRPWKGGKYPFGPAQRPEYKLRPKPRRIGGKSSIFPRPLIFRKLKT